MNKIRRGLLKIYNHLYKRDYDMDYEKCFYCGVSRECLDHRPAISLVPNMDCKKWVEDGGKFRLIPSCLDCNKYLSNKDFRDIFDCLLYLKGKYMKKVEKIPSWSEDELVDMSDSLRGLIRTNQYKRNNMIGRLEYIQSRILDWVE